MANITFKAKIRTETASDGTTRRFIRVPALTREHCDMPAFRSHPKYGSWAYSDVFPNMLDRIRRSTFRGTLLDLDKIPQNVTVDTTKFLAVVKVEV